MVWLSFLLMGLGGANFYAYGWSEGLKSSLAVGIFCCAVAIFILVLEILLTAVRNKP